MRRFLIFCLLLIMLCPLGSAKEYKEIPACLRIENSIEKTTLSATSMVYSYYPDTCLEEVDAQLRLTIDTLAQKSAPHLPEKPGNKQLKSYVDAGATVYRTGDSWASFLMTAFAVDNRTQLWVEMDAHAYDMESGKALALTDILQPEDERGWQLLADEIAAQLSSYFPQYETDEQLLHALCSRERIEQTPFTLNTAFLTLHYRADALYKGHNTLMHVRIPYTALAPYMTEEALRQTDNRDYKLVALTYDDGPARENTLSIARALRMGGCNATFFIVGDRLVLSPEMTPFVHDTGFAIASHTYSHPYGNQARNKVLKQKEQINAVLAESIGYTPQYMRAPGGNEKMYIAENVQMPLINWSFVGNENENNNDGSAREAYRLARYCSDGDIVLMHDLRDLTARFSQYIPQAFNENNTLCVSIDELFALRGIPLENNVVYYNAYSNP